MTDIPNTNPDEEGRTGEYNPSGDVPSHPADPKYGDKDDDDAYDADDDTPDDTETE